MTDRERALEILLRVNAEGAFASPLIEGLRVDDRERRFIRTIVFAVLRWRSLLDRWIEELAGRTSNKFDKTTLELLRIGAAQLLFTDVSEHAAVNETVRLAQKRASRSKGLVNAVLRAATRSTKPAVDAQVRSFDARSIAESTAHPQWLIERWVAAYGGERASRIAAAHQEHSFPDLFIPVKDSTAGVMERLRARGVRASEGRLLPFFIALESSTSEARDLIEAGDAYAMDEGSGAVAALVSDDCPGVLDLAAAPGGKSIVLSSLGRDVVANDISLARIQMLRRSSRFAPGIRLVTSDGTTPPFRRRFSAVLLDAPCSATGTIRRNPEIKWRLRPETIAELAQLQRRLLAAALELTERECLYSTCSLEREENDEVVRDVLAVNREFELVDAVDERWPRLQRWSDDGVLRLTPESGTDGFTVHKLRRT